MSTKNEKLLGVMHVLAWLAFIGLLIKAGAILISYGVSIGNPEASGHLYRGLNLNKLRQFSFPHYTARVALMTALVVLEAYIAYLVIQLLSRIKLMHPFTSETARTLERISYFVLGTWAVAMLYNADTSWLQENLGLYENYISGEFIFLAGILFVIAQIFKKGVALQTENDLTV